MNIPELNISSSWLNSKTNSANSLREKGMQKGCLAEWAVCCESDLTILNKIECDCVELHFAAGSHCLDKNEVAKARD